MDVLTIAKAPQGIRWYGPVPQRCGICEAKLPNTFIDGEKLNGGWTAMDDICHSIYGRGFGPGRGQRYTLKAEAVWLRTEG